MARFASLKGGEAVMGPPTDLQRRGGGCHPQGTYSCFAKGDSKIAILGPAVFSTCSPVKCLAVLSRTRA